MDGYFVHTCLDQLARAGIEAPVLMTSFFPGEGTQLPHDGHPNRAGHAHLAHHTIHALSSLGPLELRFSLNEVPTLTEVLETGGARHVLRAPLPPVSDPEREVVEVLIEASSHFAKVGDQRMRSFRLLWARVL